MIIERMRATFGRLDDQQLELQPGLNVISGGNESGKSTWMAFLLAMLYGVDTKDRARADRLPDKLKYQPWSGKPMCGTMELIADGRSISLSRTSRTSPMGEFRAWDTKTGTVQEDLTGRSCGQTLLGVEAAVYARSGFLGQQHISVCPDAQLEKRLSGLVTAGTEDYAYAEIDRKLKKLQTAIQHNQTGELPRAEEARRDIIRQLDELEDHRRRLAALEAEIQRLTQQCETCREILEGLDALERQDRRRRIAEAEQRLSAAREDREGWQAVCEALPAEDVLQNLEAELQQLQFDLHAALSDDTRDPEPAQPDPLFGQMTPRQIHDKTADDAALVRDAQTARSPRWKPCLLWDFVMLIGLGLGLAGILLPLLPVTAAGIVLALVGLAFWIRKRIEFLHSMDRYLELQRAARAVFEQYGAERAKDIVLRGIQSIQALQALEARDPGADNGARRKRLEALAARRKALLSRLEALIPGCGTTEKAAALFQEARQARQALAQARLLEQQCVRQLRDLQDTLGSAEAEPIDAERYAAFDRAAELQHLDSLERQLAALTSQADMLAGAIGQMGDPFLLQTEREQLDRRIRQLEDRYGALTLARKALSEADEALRARFAPLLCKKTGELFSMLTGGKYDQIQLDRNLHLAVHPVDSPVFRPLSYLSGGTADQLYFALRLAICELLIPDAPIVLDDSLVYFDDNRAALALETLSRLSRNRQVLLFTCQSREKRILDELAAIRSPASR